MKMVYPVAIHKDPGSDYGVSVPDLPGCISAGSTVAEALEMVREAIELHASGLEQDGEPVPQPTRVEDWLNHEDFADALAWALIEVELRAQTAEPVAAP